MDRPRYAWTVDGVVKSGTLVDYATDLNLGDFYGVPVGRELWNGADMTRPVFTQTAFDDDDYAWVHITVPGQDNDVADYASYRIDGRV
jgi:hypothetical protein